MDALYLPDHDSLLQWHDLPGDAPALVCLPAISFAAAPNFLSVVTQPPLATTRRILIDLPGSGMSGAIDGFSGRMSDHAALVARVLDHLSLGPAVIFGHSMGGAVAICLALARPDLVAHLVVAEGNLAPGGGPVSRAIAAQTRDAFVQTGFAQRQDRFLRAAATGDGSAAHMHAVRMGADPATMHANAIGLIELDPDLHDAFLAAPLPRTFVYGAQSLADHVVTPELPDPDLLRAHGVGIEVIADAGHLMTYDNPVALAQMLARLRAAH